MGCILFIHGGDSIARTLVIALPLASASNHKVQQFGSFSLPVLQTKLAFGDIYIQFDKAVASSRQCVPVGMSSKARVYSAVNKPGALVQCSSQISLGPLHFQIFRKFDPDKVCSIIFCRATHALQGILPHSHTNWAILAIW